jgi:hypothetical protein
MERTEDGVEHLALCRTLLRELCCKDIFAVDLGVGEQEVFDSLRRRVAIAVSRFVLLDCLRDIQCVIYAVAFLSWPTECCRVDNAIKIILLATTTGFVLRLRLWRGLNAGIRKRTPNPPCSATKTYEFGVLLSSAFGCLRHVSVEARGSRWEGEGPRDYKPLYTTLANPPHLGENGNFRALGFAFEPHWELSLRRSSSPPIA